MTGPEHYRAAEELLGSLAGRGRDELTAESASVVAEAQVHAVLALAAAIALSGLSPADERTWREAAATR